MAITLPLPVRVAAGLVAAGLERIRHLPEDLPALSVTMAGQAVRVSMRVQQEIAELAGRGDELLSGITNRPAEHPVWAHFDEDDPDPDLQPSNTSPAAAAPTPAPTPAPAPAPAQNPASAANTDPPRGDSGTPAPGRSAARTVAGRTSGRTTGVRGTMRSSAGRTSPDSHASSASAGRASTSGAAAGHASAAHASAGRTGARRSQLPDSARDEAPGSRPATSPGATAAVDGAPTPYKAGTGPAALPGYDGMTLAQVRARLRGLSPDAVTELLDRERTGAARASYLTLLTNRLTTLQAGDGQDPLR